MTEPEPLLRRGPGSPVHVASGGEQQPPQRESRLVTALVRPQERHVGSPVASRWTRTERCGSSSGRVDPPGARVIEQRCRATTSRTACSSGGPSQRSASKLNVEVTPPAALTCATEITTSAANAR